MNTMNIFFALLIFLSSALILAGIVICIFLPEQIGGKIKWGNRKRSSIALGLPLILIGVPIFLFALEPAYDNQQRRYYLRKAKYYFWSQKRYVISGGKNKTDKILVDDDLRVVVDKKVILNDKDRIRSDYSWARYKGDPIVFFSTDAWLLRIVARDVTCCTYYLSPLYLHKPDGTVMKLTDGVKGELYNQPLKQPRLFFIETYKLNH